MFIAQKLIVQIFICLTVLRSCADYSPACPQTLAWGHQMRHVIWNPTVMFPASNIPIPTEIVHSLAIFKVGLSWNRFGDCG